MAFSPEGGTLATASMFGLVAHVWDTTSGRLRTRLDVGNAPLVTSVAFSPDGHTLAIASDLGIQIVDAATLKPLRRLAGSDDTMFSAEFSADGRYVMGGSERGWARLWSAKTWRPVTRTLGGHAGPVVGTSVSPDGETLATGGADGIVRLFDVRTQQPIGAPLPTVPNSSAGPFFSPDGAYLFAITAAGRAFRWDVRPASWERQACAVAGRTLTRAEWNDALPGRAYAPACR